MNFAEKLIELRKRSGMSQEALANQMEISRQAISKWESGQAMPDISKLVSLSRVFDVSVDYLIKDEITQPPQQTSREEMRPICMDLCYEYRSRISVGSWPLVHVKFRPNGMAVARGIIAIGNTAIGGVAIGGFGLGILSFSGIGAGVLAIGGIAAGLMAMGGVAIGVIAVGAVSIAVYGYGAAVIAQKLGAGAAVNAPVAIAQESNALHALMPEQVNQQSLSAFLDQYVPDMPRFLKALMLRFTRL